MKFEVSPSDDTGLPEKLGFTTDIFEFGSLLIFEGRTVHVKYIGVHREKRRQGYVKALYRRLIGRGYNILVTRPCDEMNHLCLGEGFSPSWEYIHDCDGWCWCWRKSPNGARLNLLQPPQTI